MTGRAFRYNNETEEVSGGMSLLIEIGQVVSSQQLANDLRAALPAGSGAKLIFCPSSSILGYAMM